MIPGLGGASRTGPLDHRNAPPGSTPSEPPRARPGPLSRPTPGGPSQARFEGRMGPPGCSRGEPGCSRGEAAPEAPGGANVNGPAPWRAGKRRRGACGWAPPGGREVSRRPAGGGRAWWAAGDGSSPPRGPRLRSGGGTPRGPPLGRIRLRGAERWPVAPPAPEGTRGARAARSGKDRRGGGHWLATVRDRSSQRLRALLARTEPIPRAPTRRGRSSARAPAPRRGGGGP